MFNHITLPKLPFAVLIIWILYSILTGQGLLLIFAVPSVISITILYIIDVEVSNRLLERNQTVFRAGDVLEELVIEYNSKLWYRIIDILSTICVVGMYMYLGYVFVSAMYGVM